MVTGLSILVLMIILRYIIVTIIGGVLAFSPKEKVLSRLIYASGLPAFVMSQLPLMFDPNREFFKNPEIYPNLVMPIVLGSVLFSALAIYIAKRQLARLL
jgi:hypothetical protein